MPIYEYYCSKCQSVFELTRSFAESDKPATCAKCGSPSQKLVSAAATNADYKVKLPEKEPFRNLPRKDPGNVSPA
ncbi:MAG: zinc ribbon domain-containing protein [Chloroflexi bacterium]|nr:zinc ribbon domain-containing protein [Chloroflexota bacterium]